MPKEMKKVYDYTAMRRDLDANHHVNNVNYLELAYEAFPEGVTLDFNNIEICYKRQIKLGETVSFSYSEENGVHIVCITSEGGKVVHAILKLSN